MHNSEDLKASGLYFSVDVTKVSGCSPAGEALWELESSQAGSIGQLQVESDGQYF